MRYTTSDGYCNYDAFLQELKDSLRYMVEEGRAGHPRMMSVGLHCRLAHPGRDAAVAEFLDFARSYGRDVWICTREQIADHWMEHHYPKGTFMGQHFTASRAGKRPQRNPFVVGFALTWHVSETLMSSCSPKTYRGRESSETKTQ